MHSDGIEDDENGHNEICATALVGLRSSGSFEELVSNIQLSYGQSQLRIIVDAAFQCIAIVVVFISFLGAHGAGALSPFIDIATICFLFGAAGIHRWSTRTARRVGVNNGYITYASNASDMPERRLALNECFWFYGFSCHDGNQPLFTARPAVCITHRELLGTGGPGCIACGLSPSAYRIWEGRLRAADVRMLRRRAAHEYWTVAAVCAVTFCVIRLFGSLAAPNAANGNVQFVLAYVVAPPATCIAGTFASALLGNDRWSIIPEYKWVLTLAPSAWVAAMSVRFNLGPGYFVLLVPTLILSAICAYGITRVRYTGQQMGWTANGDEAVNGDGSEKGSEKAPG